MDERTQIATEVLKTLLDSKKWSYDNTYLVVYDAVEITDQLIKQLSRPPGSVKWENFYEENPEPEEPVEVEEFDSPESKKRPWYKWW